MCGGMSDYVIWLAEKVEEKHPNMCFEQCVEVATTRSQKYMENVYGAYLEDFLKGKV